MEPNLFQKIVSLGEKLNWGISVIASLAAGLVWLEYKTTAGMVMLDNYWFLSRNQFILLNEMEMVS